MRLPLILFVVILDNISTAHKIEHVVVAMLENRAFDHLLGFYKRVDKRVDGLKGDECNPRNLTNKAEGRVCVNDQALKSRHA